MEKTKFEPNKKKNVFNGDDEIDVCNYTTGKCIYINPRTYQEWNWEGFGDTQPIPFSELVVMKANFPRFLTDPALYILNEDVIKYFNLTQKYKTLIKPHEIDEFYQMSDDEMVEFLKDATDQTKRLIIVLTKQRIESKQLGDLFKIKLIEETLNADKSLGIQVDFFNEIY